MSRGDRSGGRAMPPGVRLAQLEELEVVVEKLVAGGEGLARFEGIPIFVPRSAPGDRLRVRLVDRRPDYGRAEIVEILSPGPGRREPPCPYFARCGGCALQHLTDERQVALKAEAVRETLIRLGGVELPGRVEVVAGRAWGYRLRTQLHVEERGGRPAVGYFARRSRELVAVDRCPILVPELESLLPILPELLPPDGPRRIDLAAGAPGTVSGAPRVEGLPGGELEIEVGGLTLAYDARCFFQAHRELVARLAERAVGEWSGEVAFDLYAGVGLFSLALAGRYRRVVAVEGDRVAARFARRNCRRNRLPRVEVLCRAVESWIRELPEGADRVVVDPPRSGLPPAVRRQLLERAPDRLTYVSCHPATLARDLRELGERYRLEALELFDLFPQSGHMETVAQLVAGS